MYRWKGRTNSKYWKMQDRKLQDLKLRDHFTGLENAGPKKEDLRHCYAEKNNAKALKVTTNISRKRVSSLYCNVSLVQVHNHLYGCPAERTPTAHGRYHVRTGRVHMEPKWWSLRRVTNTNKDLRITKVVMQLKKDDVLHCATQLHSR